MSSFIQTESFLKKSLICINQFNTICKQVSVLSQLEQMLALHLEVWRVIAY
jgi:hypothetical protein